MDKKVTVIPAMLRASDAAPKHEQNIKRVCAYCRMGSGDIYGINRELNTSYYEWYIKSKKEWSFAGIFFDEGAVGKKREGFQRMINECRDGNIDIIVTKSISRFSRDFSECLNYIKELREMGVAVFFELERIWSDNARNDAVFTGLFALECELHNAGEQKGEPTDG